MSPGLDLGDLGLFRLNAGGIVEYDLGSRFSLGVDARYMYAFFNREGLHAARVTARGRWRF